MVKTFLFTSLLLKGTVLLYWLLSGPNWPIEIFLSVVIFIALTGISSYLYASIWIDKHVDILRDEMLEAELLRVSSDTEMHRAQAWARIDAAQAAREQALAQRAKDLALQEANLAASLAIQAARSTSQQNP